ncbi:hypothetical protein [Nocardiopsis sp. JB363]|uniref:hypothetical protein n=1 Tax=Nocardiopsis sp. JB363 TaxID=1434837 RepID=UPI00117F183A|nr:hypothetical protein [Nocardiopsis sp. JB363]
MSLHEVGVNVHDAYGAGASAEEYASAFNGLHDDFNDVLSSASAACADDPKVGGWSDYGEEQAEAIARVENHGISLAENVQGGASETANVDSQASEVYNSTDVPMARPVNIK